MSPAFSWKTLCQVLPISEYKTNRCPVREEQINLAYSGTAQSKALVPLLSRGSFRFFLFGCGLLNDAFGAAEPGDEFKRPHWNPQLSHSKARRSCDPLAESLRAGETP